MICGVKPNSLAAAVASEATFWRASSRRASRTRFRPAFANRIAVEAPIPDEAPVMTAARQLMAVCAELTSLALEAGRVEELRHFGLCEVEEWRSQSQSHS